jgi:hypothetical protein|tara:strand:+ start:3672 stop:5204 length:1533 start_codon:yes stop_codon:yes gene_type:complete
MTQLSLQKLNRRIDAAEGIQMQYKALFESAYELALPQRNLWTTFSQGSNKMEKVYSSSGISALNGFVNRMQSSLTPPFTTWAELKAGPAIDDSIKIEINRILKEVTETTFSFINGSNFAVAVGEMYYDLAVGTGAMLVLEGDDEKPIKFISVPTSELALDEGENGQINGIFRKHKVAARGIFATWPDVKPTNELLDLIKDDPEKEVEFKETTYLDEEDKIWRYEIIYNKEHRIVERTFETNPWIIVRWSKVAGEVFGRGPLLQALPDLKELNKGKELNLRSAQLNIFGAYTVADDGITNVDTIKIQPNALIPVARNAGPNGPSIAALPRTGDFNAQNFMFEDLKQQINTLLLNDRLPPDAGPVRSATEIVERMKQLQVDTGAAFGRLIFEFVQPLLQRIIQILENKGLIKLGGGIKIDNIAVTTQILSPIARTEAIEEVNGIVQTDQILKSIDPTGQLTQLTLKTEELAVIVADKLGVPASMIRSEDEKDTLKQSLVEAVATQEGAPQEA